MDLDKIRHQVQATRTDKPEEIEPESLDEGNFHRKNRLGHSSYGTVYMNRYKGELVAVKTAHDLSVVARADFKQELTISCGVSFPMRIDTYLSVTPRKCGPYHWHPRDRR